MNTNLNCNSSVAEYECYGPGEITELVRGNDQVILERFLPLVRDERLALDLGGITRIDAAGLAALIRLYCAAHESGQSFVIANPSPHVAEILHLVGLDRILQSEADREPLFFAPLQESAA